MMTFDTFKQEAFDPFSVSVLVLKGEMWLGMHGTIRHLTPGSTFEVDYEVPHSERYGPEGATYWVARKK